MRKNIYTIGLLLLLTLMTAIVSMYYGLKSWATMTILAVSAIKFLLVAFQFMELKRAHTLWKVLTVGYLFIVILIVSIVLY